MAVMVNRVFKADLNGAGIRQGFEALAKKVQEHHEYLKASSNRSLMSWTFLDTWDFEILSAQSHVL